TTHQPLQDLVIQVNIDSDHGHMMWGTTSRRSGQALSLVDGPARVELHIPSLPLLEGRYHLSVGITDSPETHMFDRWERRICFDVRQLRAYDMGAVHIPVSWSISGTRNIVQRG
ncbi:MAG: hypothetical protein FGM45_10910, partial [Actinobacteria bacterium]|nr:hypothetical protein [Actinomycetota bacterium]